MTRPKLTKGPDRYTIQQLRKKAEEFWKEKDHYRLTMEWINEFLEYLEAQK